MLRGDRTFRDRILRCVECLRDFTWTAAQQQFYREKGFHQPKRCRACRLNRRKDTDERLF